ncbi:DNA sulfur modification protein DndD [Mesorhizobium wenxiniae]|uniref:DNA sulfur modification protein DndD n=1 Tax=Mesorhizobium wenxiniae TaxID=2014805 RepID=A0A271KPA1_9HYPH|nr:DNA sulfur modification protein DndD [Mesorhizobium wenxiniae]PAP96927.1 DNA sulfur modification protein DndD [Mesorhizobium wenxiniae]
MWISKIELTCFKSYQHQEFTFPEPNNGKNVVLIGGMNGYGKTSVLEALYLCLYGKDAMAHLARAGLKTDDVRGYPTFLEKAFNGEALRDGRDTMLVRVTVNRSKAKAIEITRKWYFRSNGSWTDEEATVRTITRNVPDMPRSDGKNGFHLADMLDDLFVPAHIAPFFFFDGEEVKKLADQSRIEQVKQGLEGLLGVVLLRSLSDRLRQFENSRRQGVVTVDEERLAQLERTLRDNEQQEQDIAHQIDVAKDQKRLLADEFQSLLERVTSAGGGGGDTATYKELVEEREQYRASLRENMRDQEEILSGRLPFHLASKNILETLRSQLEAELRYFKWEGEKQALEPRKNEFRAALESQASPLIQPPLSDEQTAALNARLDAAWACLFYPPPDDCAEKIIHSYLTPPERSKMLEYLDSIAVSQREIQDLLSEHAQLTQRIDDLGRKISKLEGIDRDGTLAALTQQLKDLQQKIDSVDEEIRADERRRTGLETQVVTQRADYERERKKLDDSSPARSVIKKSDRIRRVIEDLIPALFPLKVKQLASSMTQVYRQLAHKDQVSRIFISNDGTSQILGKSGRPITFDRSAGENQIFATALIAGLAKVSGINAPLVVDTPLGRLDSRHRHNILQFWTSDESRQVILLSQDKEIDAEFHRRISKHVAKTYLLDHTDVGDGVGRTSAREDRYFVEAAE